MYHDKDQSFFRRILSLPGKILDGISWLGTSIEKSFRRITLRSDRANEALDNVDSIFGRFLGRLFFPFQVTASIGLAAISWLAERAGNSQLFRFFQPALRVLFYPLIAVYSFFTSLIQTRSRKIILWSIPLVILFGAVFLLLWQIQSQRANMFKNYQLAVEHAIANEAFDKAQLYQQKLQQLGMRTEQLEMLRIEELAEAGKWEQAIAEAERISPLEKVGLAVGHYWLVRQYLAGKRPGLTREKSLERAQLHLENLKTALRTSTSRLDALPPEIVFLESSLLLEAGRVDQALPLLKKISDLFWPALLLEMEVNARTGNLIDAKQNSLQIANFSARNPEILAQVPENFFPLWCGLLAQTGDSNKFKESVRAWYRTFPESQSAFLEWSRIQLSEIELLTGRGGEADLSRASQLLLEIGSRIDDNQRDWLSAWLINNLPPQSNNQSYLTLARRTANSPSASSILLELLGTAAFLRNEADVAIELLKRAIELDPRNAVALNNAAYILLQSFPDQEELALQFAERAVELEPTNHEMRETRGMLLVKARQWERAIGDLSIALANNPDSREIHGALAKAYLAIGRLEMAGIHQNMAD